MAFEEMDESLVGVRGLRRVWMWLWMWIWIGGGGLVDVDFVFCEGDWLGWNRRCGGLGDVIG